MTGEITQRPRLVPMYEFIVAIHETLHTTGLIDRARLAYRERDDAEFGRIIAERIDQILEGE